MRREAYRLYSSSSVPSCDGEKNIKKMMKMEIKSVDEDTKDGEEDDDNDDGGIIEENDDNDGGDGHDRSARATLEAEIKHMEMTLRSHANELPKISMDIDERKQRQVTMVTRI